MCAGYTIKWNFKMQPQSEGRDVDFFVQVVDEKDDIIKASKFIICLKRQ